MFENTDKYAKKSYTKYALILVVGVIACFAFFSSSNEVPQDSVQDPKTLVSWAGCHNVTGTCWTWCQKTTFTVGWCYSTN